MPTHQGLIEGCRTTLPEIPAPELSILSFLQLAVGVGLLNVWLIRAGSATGYRGGEAKKRSVPATLMLLMCVGIVFLT